MNIMQNIPEDLPPRHNSSMDQKIHSFNPCRVHTSFNADTDKLF